jgi:hypothetical protein
MAKSPETVLTLKEKDKKGNQYDRALYIEGGEWYKKLHRRLKLFRFLQFRFDNGQLSEIEIQSLFFQRS